MVVGYTHPPQPPQPMAAGVVGGAKGVEVGGDYDVDEETEEGECYYLYEERKVFH